MRAATARISAAIAATLVGMLTLMAPATASGQPTETKREFTATAQVALIEPGKTTAGLFELRFDGGKIRNGALETHERLTGQPDPSTLENESNGRFYFPRGSISFSLTGTTTLHPDGSVEYTGRGTVDGGGGTFGGATGRLTLMCSGPNVTSIITCEANGTISY